MDLRIDGWIDGWVGRMDEWVGGWMGWLEGECVDWCMGLVDGLMYEWMNRRMNG